MRQAIEAGDGCLDPVETASQGRIDDGHAGKKSIAANPVAVLALRVGDDCGAIQFAPRTGCRRNCHQWQSVVAGNGPPVEKIGRTTIACGNGGDRLGTIEDVATAECDDQLRREFPANGSSLVNIVCRGTRVKVRKLRPGDAGSLQFDTQLLDHAEALHGVPPRDEQGSRGHRTTDPGSVADSSQAEVQPRRHFVPESLQSSCRIVEEHDHCP